MAEASTVKPAAAALARWREKIVDTAVLAIPGALVTKGTSWLQVKFLGEPWQVLWILLPLVLAAWLTWRLLHRPHARRPHWGFFVFLGVYCSMFAVASATDLLVWKRMPTGYDAGGATGRNWLVPIELGDWRYRLVSPAISSKARFAVIVLEHPAGATRERLRVNDRRAVALARRAGARGIAFDVAYAGSSDVDNLFCRSIVGYPKPIILPVSYKARPDGDFVRSSPDVPATLSCLVGRESGHAMAIAEADGRIRSIPLYWEGDENRPALSLRVARSLGGSDLKVPNDRLLRFVPAAPNAIKVYRGLDEPGREPQLLEDRFVFIGEDSPEDTFSTPFGALPGAQIHALAANSLLAGHSIQRPSAALSAFVVFACCYVLVLFGAQGSGVRTLALVATGLTLAVFALAAAAIYFFAVWLDAVYAVAATWLLLPLLMAFRKLAPAGAVAHRPSVGH